MKSFLTFLMIATGMFFTGCVSDKKIINYALNDDNTVYVVYESGDYEVIGTLQDVLSSNEYSIFPSTDGYYIINGIKTTIETLSYKVSFDTNSKETYESQIIKWREKIKKPNINKKGYTLDGWYNDDKLWNFDVNIVESDLNLVAKWIPNEYKITLKEETPTDSLPIIIKSGETYNLPKLKNDHKIFLGWELNNELVPFTGIFDYASDIDLIAKWSINQYAIHFNPNNGCIIKSLIVDMNQEVISLPIPVNNGYKFLGWYHNDEPVQLPLKLNNTIELNAKWEKK